MAEGGEAESTEIDNLLRLVKIIHVYGDLALNYMMKKQIAANSHIGTTIQQVLGKKESILKKLFDDKVINKCQWFDLFGSYTPDIKKTKSVQPEGLHVSLKCILLLDETGLWNNSIKQRDQSLWEAIQCIQKWRNETAHPKGGDISQKCFIEGVKSLRWAICTEIVRKCNIPSTEVSGNKIEACKTEQLTSSDRKKYREMQERWQIYDNEMLKEIKKNHGQLIQEHEATQEIVEGLGKPLDDIKELVNQLKERIDEIDGKTEANTHGLISHVKNLKDSVTGLTSRIENMEKKQHISFTLAIAEFTSLKMSFDGLREKFEGPNLAQIAQGLNLATKSPTESLPFKIAQTHTDKSGQKEVQEESSEKELIHVLKETEAENLKLKEQIMILRESEAENVRLIKENQIWKETDAKNVTTLMETEAENVKLKKEVEILKQIEAEHTQLKKEVEILKQNEAENIQLKKEVEILKQKEAENMKMKKEIQILQKHEPGEQIKALEGDKGASSALNIQSGKNTCDVQSLVEARDAKFSVGNELTGQEGFEEMEKVFDKKVDLSDDKLTGEQSSSPLTYPRPNGTSFTPELKELRTDEEEITSQDGDHSHDVDIKAAKKDVIKMREDPETLVYDYSNQLCGAAEARVPIAVKFYTERMEHWRRSIENCPSLTKLKSSELMPLFEVKETKRTICVQFKDNGICCITGKDVEVFANSLFNQFKCKLDSSTDIQSTPKKRKSKRNKNKRK